ncbi:MAG: VWA domain-containing protein [Planctomycetota bacterium]
MIAALLALLLLATLFWPLGQDSNGINGDTGQQSGLGTEAGVGVGDSGTHGQGESGSTAGGGADDSSVSNSAEQTGSLATDASVSPSSVSSADVIPDVLSENESLVSDALKNATPDNRPAESATTPPPLGFQSDLLAASVNPPAAATPRQSDVGTANPGLASFFGQTGRGSRFVYIIDRSGSMQGDRFDAARFELIKSIRSLREHERFYVIFYSTNPIPMPASKLQPATPKNQQQQIDWIRTVSVGGGTNPTEAMSMALTGLKPDTIWLLSDGQFNVQVADTIKRLNPGARVQINTIAFHEKSGEAILKIIADENDGDYRFVAP